MSTSTVGQKTKLYSIYLPMNEPQMNSVNMQIYLWNCKIYLLIAFSFFNPASPALAQHACISKHFFSCFLSLSLFPPISSNLCLL